MDVPSNHELIKQIKRYQFCIQRADSPENDPQRILHYIRKLSKLPVKLEELEKTGIGKTINSLRKRNGSIAEEATLLVAKWKSIVKKQVEEEEASEKSYSKENSSQSDYDSVNNDSYTNYVDDIEYKNKISENEENTATDDDKAENVKKSKKKIESTKGKIHLITIKKDLSCDRKRKYSNEEKEKNTKKEKYKKIRKSSSDINISGENDFLLNNVYIKQEMNENEIIQETNYSQNEGDIQLNKKKRSEKENEKKSHKKDHEKRHHKSSKHASRKTEKPHRYHSKNSHHDKKHESDDKFHKHRVDKKSKSRSKHENEVKEQCKEKKSLEIDWSDKKLIQGSDNYDSCSEKTNEHMGNDFGAVLLGIPATTSPKKKSISSKSSNYQDSPSSSSPKQNSEIDSLSNIKLEPLSKDLHISDVSYVTELNSPQEKYSIKVKSNGEKWKKDSSPPYNFSPKEKLFKTKLLSEEDMFSSMTTTKNQRTKVYSGFKANSNVKFPTLFELCIRILQDNFDALEYTGGVPYDVLKPILEKVTADQLYTFENYNPYLIGETDKLWEFHAKKHFRKAERLEYETWRDLYLRCVEEREEKLQSLTENISQSIANSVPVRKTKLAYLGTVVKPPRNVARSQAKHGTGQLIVKKSSKEPQPSLSAIQSVKERFVKEATNPNAIHIPTKQNLLVKKKKAPLMQKTLQLFKGLKR